MTNDKNIIDLLRDIHNIYDELMHEIQDLQLKVVSLQKENENLLNETNKRTDKISES